MATTYRGIETPDLSDPVKPTSQMAAAAQDTDDAIGRMVGLTEVVSHVHATPFSLQTGWQGGTPGIEFVPPSGWGHYQIMVVATAAMYGLQDLDQVRGMVRQVTPGVNPSAGRSTSSDAGSNRVFSSLLVSSQTSGTRRYYFRALNETATRGTVSSVFMHLIATRRT